MYRCKQYHHKISIHVVSIFIDTNGLRACVTRWHRSYWHSTFHRVTCDVNVVQYIWEKIQKITFPENGWIKKLMVPSETAPRDHSNEWSCQYVSTILNYFGGQFLCPAIGDRSHHSVLKELRKFLWCGRYWTWERYRHDRNYFISFDALSLSCLWHFLIFQVNL
jgi:hypothetical protein